MRFDELGLAEPLLRAVAEAGYTTPTPIQQQAIPAILAGRDVLAGARTGTGKTAGFTLPLLHLLAGQPILPKPKPPRVLILTPTRELTQQVYESVLGYGRYLPFFAEAIYGGVSIRPQIQKLSRGTDIVIATPGRLLDLRAQDCVDLSRVEYLVLDEADRMLDLGFIRDIRKILGFLPPKRQNLLFSATYSAEISALAGQLLHNPLEIAVAARNSAAETVEQRVYPIKRENKRELLSYLIGSQRWRQVLVFVRTKHGADRLCQQLLRDGVRCAALHGDKSQGARLRALQMFKDGEVTALVATDVAARGLDIDLLPFVVNYDLPQVAEDYVHRIGRTGRAGAEGQAISLVDAEEAYLLAAIEKLLGKTIPRVKDTGYERVDLSEAVKKPAAAKPAGGQRKAQARGEAGRNQRPGAKPAARPGRGRNEKTKKPGNSRH